MSRARRGHQVAAVAVARKLTVLCSHLLTRGEDYLWARPALVANKTRAMGSLGAFLRTLHDTLPRAAGIRSLV